jgi:hypothetical protein
LHLVSFNQLYTKFTLLTMFSVVLPLACVLAAPPPTVTVTVTVTAPPGPTLPTTVLRSAPSLPTTSPIPNLVPTPTDSDPRPTAATLEQSLQKLIDTLDHLIALEAAKAANAEPG